MKLIKYKNLISIICALFLLVAVAVPAFAHSHHSRHKNIAVSQIILNETNISIRAGGVYNLTTTILPDNAINKIVTWRSNNTDVAKVDRYGKVSGIKAGQATITATSSNRIRAKCYVTVVNVPVPIDPVVDPVIDPIVDPVVDPIVDPIVDPVITPNKVLEGAWLGRWAFSSEGKIQEWNQLAGRNADIIHTFVDTSTNMSHWKPTMDYVKSQGAVNLLTLQTNGYSTVDINNGKLDTYFTTLAKDIKSWQNGSEVIIRLFHEQNGNWYDWSIGDSNVNTNTTLKQAYQRIVKIFRDNGATNVKFDYNVNCNNNGSGASYMGAYPGDDYVDFVSMDGYNWGNTQSWSQWQSFRSIFDSAYNALTSGSNKPVIIDEFASTENGGNKATWINDMQKQIAEGTYPKLYAIIWFNQNKETDWRIQSSPSSLEAYKN